MFIELPMPRYAVYFAPTASSLLWQKGCRWLGRDPERDLLLEQPVIDGLSARIEQITASPRGYGLHATLKAPFALASGYKEDDLHEAFVAFAAARRALTLPKLQVSVLDGFLALTPVAPSAELNELAAACVTQFDHFRRSADPAEIGRRLRTSLTANQREMLSRWGYPYVLNEYRFHMTLTDRLAPADAAGISRWLSDYFGEALAEPLAVNDIALFVQPEPS
ncbi:MAG TPA: DUF1045 domain-containing protein, partial [Burkholderiales bacterium]|nr:DUF1045 domain-containing protein [Burkholderiales bacterium]